MIVAFRAELNTALPEYYVMLCAQRYAEAVRKLSAAITDEELRRVKAQLSHILESGRIEFKREYERRVRPYPDDIRKALIRKESFVSRSITSEEAEMVRYGNAVPAFNQIDNLSAQEMLGLADMYEGWAQDGRLEGVDVARLHGWADGFRSLVEVVGTEYDPPEAAPGARVSLLKFLAAQMRRSTT